MPGFEKITSNKHNKQTKINIKNINQVILCNVYDPKNNLKGTKKKGYLASTNAAR